MKSKKNEQGRPFLRKAFGVLMVLVLLAAFGRIVLGAVSFISENAERPEKLDGPTFTIEGEGCSLDQDTADCCEDACLRWCLAKGREVWKAGVVDSSDMKCSCMCSSDGQNI